MCYSYYIFTYIRICTIDVYFTYRCAFACMCLHVYALKLSTQTLQLNAKCSWATKHSPIMKKLLKLSGKKNHDVFKV